MRTSLCVSDSNSIREANKRSVRFSSCSQRPTHNDDLASLGNIDKLDH